MNFGHSTVGASPGKSVPIGVEVASWPLYTRGPPPKPGGPQMLPGDPGGASRGADAQARRQEHGGEGSLFGSAWHSDHAPGDALQIHSFLKCSNFPSTTQSPCLAASLPYGLHLGGGENVKGPWALGTRGASLLRNRPEGSESRGSQGRPSPSP